MAAAASPPSPSLQGRSTSILDSKIKKTPGKVGAFVFGLALVGGAIYVGSQLLSDLSQVHPSSVWPFVLLGFALAIAAACLSLIAKDCPNGYDPATLGFAANGYGDHSPGQYGIAACLVTEVILTFFLVFTVIGTTDIKAPVGFAGIPIGLVLTLIHLVGIPITNTSVNPARSIGPALFAGGWALQQLWLFLVAPLAGGALAAFVYRGFAVRLLTQRDAQHTLILEQERKLKSREAIP